MEWRREEGGAARREKGTRASVGELGVLVAAVWGLSACKLRAMFARLFRPLVGGVRGPPPSTRSTTIMCCRGNMLTPCLPGTIRPIGKVRIWIFLGEWSVDPCRL